MEKLEVGEQMNNVRWIPMNPAVSTWQHVQIYFNILNHMLIFSVAIYMTFLCVRAGNLPISWHAWLCTIGYQLLMTQAIMAFYSQNAWSKNHTQPMKRLLHWVLQAIGSTMAIGGIIIEYVNRSTHFKHTHSVIGLTATILTLIGMLNGVSALWSIELRKYVAPIYLKFLHNLNGLAAFVLGMVALYYGYDKKYMIKNSQPDVRLWLQAVTIITIVLSLFGALKALINYARNIVKI